jgi:hypothetical protein
MNAAAACSIRARAPGRPKPGSALLEGRSLYSASGVLSYLEVAS